MPKVAVVQKPPILLHREATLQQVVLSITEAARQGASLIVFPEAYVPGYPAWIWRLRPGPDMPLAAELHARLRTNAVDLSGPHLDTVRAAAAEHRVTVALGVHELDTASRIPPSTTPWFLSGPMALCSTAIANWCRPIPSAWYGAAVTLPG